MLETLQQFANSLPPELQWLAVIALGAIPFIESYLGSVIGVVAGLSVWVAVPAAILGNLVSTWTVVLVASRIRSRVIADGRSKELSPRRAKLKARFDRFGVPGVSMLGQLILPSQITSAAIVSFGASHRAVLLWQTISVITWGVVSGALAAAGINLFAELR